MNANIKNRRAGKVEPEPRMTDMLQNYCFTVYDSGSRTLQEAGSFVLALAESGVLREAHFEYNPDYLEKPHAIALLPTLPLGTEYRRISCERNGVAAFVDELLPDSWGRRLTSLIAPTFATKGHLPIEELFCLMPFDFIGRFAALPYGGVFPPQLNAIRAPSLSQRIFAAQRVDAGTVTPTDLAVLYRCGACHLKGARPKFLTQDNQGRWLAKVARATDDYDVLLAEHTALQIARAAGLESPVSRLETVDGNQVLLIQRFDLQSDGSRSHLISANAQLKDERTQEDRSQPRYDDLASLVHRYSTRPKEDLRQLLGQALLNAALRNTDDHLRNFSFLADEKGMRLSPAYDIVPTPITGAYHQLGWGYSSSPPSLQDAGAAALHLGLDASEGKLLAEAIRQALDHFKEPLQQAGVPVRRH